MPVNPAISPNLYQLQGQQIHVTYSTSSFDGKPRFDYQDAYNSLQFVGDEIRTATSEIGTLVSVSIRKTIDTGSTSFTLLLPNINLENTKQASIITEGITTIHRFSVVPMLRQGQTQLYNVTQLSGTAQAVDF
jgi:hypothetical protein